MKKKTFLFLLIVFVTVGLIGYFITQPVIQAQDYGGNEAIKGNVYYSGVDCQSSTGDQVDVYRLTAGGADYVTSAPVILYGPGYRYVVTPEDIGYQTGYYRLVPDLYSAFGNSGVDPQVRDSVWWQDGMVTSNQNFTAVTCKHP